MKLNIQNTFTSELPADLDTSNTIRQVDSACYSFVEPKKTKSPKIIHISKQTAELIGLSEADCNSTEFLNIFTGNEIIENSKPFAMCYAGHQFGNWAGQLGDGRAINIAEVEHNNKHWALQLKGAGPTPYSRHAVGLAVLRSSIREHLCSEAMFHLGVPTTRSLSLALTGDDVWRDVMYNGNPAFEKGAVVCRVAPSFLRFGNYQIFASKGDAKTLQTLVNYTITHFFPSITLGSIDSYIEFFRQVSLRTIDMIIHWQRVGFVHGVMNTDNMSILGLTIDYGPYGWIEGYDTEWTPNTTDSESKRYKYGAQGSIGVWNLLQLANALYPLINNAEPLNQILGEYKEIYESKYIDMMRTKLGLERKEETDSTLIKELKQTLQRTETDMTIFFRNLSNVSKEIYVNNVSFANNIQEALYKPDELNGDILLAWKTWIDTYIQRLQLESATDQERRAKMDAVNPKYVLRNYMAQIAIDAANIGNYSVIDELYNVLQKPYDEQPHYQKWFAKRPEWARSKVGCSMLSCSS